MSGANPRAARGDGAAAAKPAPGVVGGGAEPTRIGELLARYPDKFGDLLEDPAGYRMQVLVGVQEHLGVMERWGYRVDAEYFYPASTVKLCTALAASHVLWQLQEAEIAVSRVSPFVIHPLRDGEREFVYEIPPTHARDKKMRNRAGTFDGIGRDIRRSLIVSDNPAANRLYEIVGHDALNRLMWRAGLTTVRFNHRLSDFRTPEEQRRTARVDFYAGDELTHSIPERLSQLREDNATFAVLAGLLAGKAYVDPETGVRVDRPMDFTGKNRIGLMDLQHLIGMMLPAAKADLRPPEVDAVDAANLINATCDLPRQCPDLHFDRTEHTDERYKWYLPGLKRLRGGSAVTICNKIGRAYGFSTDTAMIFPLRVPKTPRPTLFLAATLFTCRGGVLNNDAYEYERADRFFADLGEVVAREFWGLRGR